MMIQRLTAFLLIVAFILVAAACSSKDTSVALSDDTADIADAADITEAPGAVETPLATTLESAASGTEASAAPTASEAAQPDKGDALELIHATTENTETFFAAINAGFIQYWNSKSKQALIIKEVAGNSLKQSQAINEGQLKADVVTLGVGLDIDAIQTKGLIKEGWQQRLENNSSPYTTAVAFVVRKGNPKAIKEWEDIAKPGIQVVVANPKTYSDARWSYLGAWANALYADADEEKTKAFVKAVYANAPALYADNAAAKTAFLNDNKGDVWITTEFEALQIANSTGKDSIAVVVPSISLAVEPIVSVVDSNAKADGTSLAASSYLNYLYTEDAQNIAAKNYYRPRLDSILENYADQFADVTLLTVDDDLGGWDDLQKAHFVDGGIFDQIAKK